MRKNKFIKYFLLAGMVVLLFAAAFSCQSPTGPNNSLSLTLEDVSCTETWIKVTGETGSELVLNRDNKEVQRFILTSSPQTIYDDSLLPNTNYQYQVSGIGNQKSSDKVTVTTLDSTSHDFTFETYTFGGQAGSCVLYDVAIIDENNIWAVGEIYLLDSLGQPDPQPYNLAVWDGKNWKLQKLTYKGFPPVVHSLYAVDEHDVWLDPWLHWNGENFQEFPIDPVLIGAGINKIGGNKDGIYVVGDRGFIAHRSASGTWTKIESGTDLNINDIYGAFNDQTNEYEILAVASNILESLDRDLLSIKGSTVTHLSTEPLDGTLSSIWFKPGRTYYIAGGGIYEKQDLGESLWKNNHFDITSYYTYRIRGNNYNEIAATGGVGEIIYFNGYSWYSYIDQTRLPAGNYYGLAIKENIIVAVGQNNPQAVIVIGKRTN